MRIRVLALCLLLGACVTERTGVLQPEQELTSAAALNVQLGFEYLRSGKRADAVAKFERAVEQDGDNAQARYGLALVNEQVGDFKAARRFYQQAMDKAPGDAAISNAYGGFLCRRGEYEEGVKAFMVAARSLTYRTPETAHTNAGICLRKKDPVRAEQHLRDALASNPQYPQALFELADLSLERGEPLKSRAFLQRLREEVRPDARTLLLSYRTEKKLGDERASARFADQLRREFPNSPEILELDGKPKQ
jgi:type IV pilus assembly protein PilF